MTDQAHARSTDPETSHEAAAAVTPDLRELQARVEAYARRMGGQGFVDAQMEEDLDDDGSTMRSRRAELTERNIILSSGSKRRWGESVRRRVVWIHRDFVDNPPPVIDAPKPIRKEDRDRAVELSGTLGRSGPILRGYGLAALAGEIEDAAKLLRRLAT